MQNLEEQRITCPYCGEGITVFIDASAGDQSYIEDCQVCCRPIEFELNTGFGDTAVLSVRSDNE